MSLLALTAAEIDALVGANLRRLREDACEPVAALAWRLGMTPERLAAAEGGTAHLGAGELLAVMQRLRCGFDALFARPPAERLPS